MAKFIIKLISAGLTAFGVYLIIKGDLTNGLLAIIAGEVSDMEKIK